MASEWPPKERIIGELLATAQSYATDAGNISHPQDIADALTTAIEVAWRTIRPVGE